MLNSIYINIINNNKINAESKSNDNMINIKGCKYRKCKKYGHYTKTCKTEIL